MSYLQLPQLSSDYVSIPDSAALSISGDVQWVWRGAIDVYTSGNQALISKVGGGGQRGPNLYVQSDGVVKYWWSNDGTAVNIATATVALQTVVTPSDLFWFKLTHDVDNGAADSDITFWYSVDDTDDPTVVTWVQLGAVVQFGSTTSNFNNTEPVRIGKGSTSVAHHMGGKVRRGLLYNGIDGTKVLDVDATSLTDAEATAGSFTEKSSNAATVTINGSSWSYILSEGIRIDIGFGDTFKTAAPTWVDVTGWVRPGLTTVHGRDRETQQAQPGKASFILDNTDRRFEPEYAAGAYYPDIKPLVPVQIRNTHSGVTYPVWRGFIEGWPQQYPDVGHDATVKIECIDAFGMFNVARVDMYRDVVLDDNPVAYWPMDEGSGTIARDISSSGSSLNFINGMDWVQDGPFSKVKAAADFDRVVALHYGDTGPKTDLAITGDLTVEVWCKAGQLGSSAYLVDCRSTDTTSLFSLWTEGSDETALNVLFGWQNDSVTRAWFGDGEDHDLTGWTHIVATRGGSHTTFTPAGPVQRIVRIYINGVELVSGGASVDGLQYVDPVLSSVVEDYRVMVGGENFNPDAGNLWDGSIAHVAIYNSVVSPARVAAHYAATVDVYGEELSGTRVGGLLDGYGWPAADRSVDVGQSTFTAGYIGSRSILAHLRECAASEGGLFFIGKDGKAIFQDRSDRYSAVSSATFGDSGSDIRYEDIEFAGYDTLFLFNEVSIRPFDQSPVTVKDTASQDLYGQRVLPISRVLVSDVEENTQAASWWVAAYKDPRVRVSKLVVQLERDAVTSYPAVLALEVGDRVTVNRTPPTGATVSQDVFIEEITHTADLVGWVVEFQLSPAEIYDVWTLEDATLGELGAYPLSY